MRPIAFFALSLPLALMGCGDGDNSSVRAFHSAVKTGTPLVQAVADGEQAQKPDITYAVNGRHCGGPEVRAGRDNDEPYIRITEPGPESSKPLAQPYQEIGYATRDDFARGLAETLPRFYSCEEFRFTFGRSQGWPASDSFSVTIDSQGRIAKVSDLRRDGD